MVEEKVVIFCPKCNLYQASLTVYYGRKIKNKKCVRCSSMISLEECIKIDEKQISEYIRKLNYPKELISVDELPEFE